MLERRARSKGKVKAKNCSLPNDCVRTGDVRAVLEQSRKERRVVDGEMREMGSLPVR